MIERVDARTWFVKCTTDSAPEAIIDRFGGGYRLRKFDLSEARRRSHGVYTGVEIAETEWWRIRERRGH